MQEIQPTRLPRPEKTLNQKGGGNMETMVRSARSHETFELITGENDLGETSEYLLPHYCSSF